MIRVKGAKGPRPPDPAPQPKFQCAACLPSPSPQVSALTVLALSAGLGPYGTLGLIAQLCEEHKTNLNDVIEALKKSGRWAKLRAESDKLYAQFNRGLDHDA